MKYLILLGLAALAASSPAPQYSDEKTQTLTAENLDTLKDIFGSSGDLKDAYGSGTQQSGALNDGVEVIVQIVKNEVGETAPDDYVSNGDLTNNKVPTSTDNVFENCHEYTESQGFECVPYYQCGTDGQIITDGEGLIDVRNGFGILTPEDSKCPGFLDVCCKDPDFVAPPPAPVVKHVARCGQRHENGLGVRIQGFNEYESQFGEWPHMCAVLAEEAVEQAAGYAGEPQTVNLFQCGGSLIAPGVILTAAHCVKKFEFTATKLKVRCGEWDTQTQNEPREHQDRTVDSVTVHPEFSERNLAHDWALIFTTNDFELQDHIDTICLPPPDEVFDGQTCFATGWGKDQFGAAGEYQIVLKEIGLPVVGHADCQTALQKTRLGKRFKLDDSFICAGGQAGSDTCKGDGGSPLVCASKNNPNSYVQSGIVAWGIGCGEDNTPGVYASVPKAVCWIDYVMSCKNGAATGDFSSLWGYSASQCQSWWDTDRLADINYKISNIQAVDTSLTGRKRASQLAKNAAGEKAKTARDLYDQCTVYWAPIEASPLSTGDGYGGVDGGVVDIAGLGLERDGYPAAPLTQDGAAYSEDGEAVKLTAGTYTEDTADLTSGETKTAPY